MTIFVFDFFKSIKIELSDKALEFGVPEEFRKDFFLNEGLVENINKSQSLIPGDNMRVDGILE